MQKLYEKSELWFALAWIGVYVAGASIADRLSEQIGVEKCITFPFLAVLSVFVLVWLGRRGLFRKYGICKGNVKASRFLYYLPLVVLTSCNLWQGVALNLPFTETALYVGSMLCVGFLEELIFRGFLFKAMSKDGLKAAVIVSSLTFGIGHLVNLVNGSGMGLLANLCQVCSAVAFGFMCVVIFHRGGSLIPCMVTHGCFNALSVFANEEQATVQTELFTSLILMVLAGGYALVLLKLLPQRND